ncbi:MAG TPA: carboxymuconolactone decarboxylase family protein [Thermopolyspora sp.]|jgi:alkylhydroperoxidase AhpD family core domain
MSETAKAFERGLAGLHRDPTGRPVMEKFRLLHEAALSDGALSRTIKELMALCVSITSQCDGCIAWHIQGAIRAGASREQVVETINLAILMGGGPATYYGSKALAELDRASSTE